MVVAQRERFALKTLEDALRDYMNGDVNEVYMYNMTRLLEDLAENKDYQSIISMSLEELEKHPEHRAAILAAVFQAGALVGMDMEKNELHEPAS